MVWKIRRSKLVSAIAVIGIGMLLGCTKAEKTQVSTPPLTSPEISQQVPPTPQTTASNKLNQLLTTRQCPGCNFQGVDLEKADLRGVNLSNANLNDADLTQANLSNAKLSGANLTDADLKEANLTRANLRNANFTSADLEDAILTNADVNGANFTGADIEGIVGLNR
ncbi:pentapeptide repeat-containing protein [Nodularia chucula]|uniref:pentapeptide repeat-containing protein n=1 Tax=Nodularia chucula TaxID=3093667 RepID=UPI0039C74430